MDINLLIQKMDAYIEKGERGTQNDPWDIRWYDGGRQFPEGWQHRHSNYDWQSASRGNWHPIKMKHPSLGEKGHDNYLKFEETVLFGGKIPGDTLHQAWAKAVREKYVDISPTKEAHAARAIWEGLINTDTWTDAKIPEDVRAEIESGAKTRAGKIGLPSKRKDIGEREPPVEVLEKPKEPVKEVPTVNYRNILENEGVSVKDTKSGTYVYNVDKKGNINSDIFRISETVDNKYKITAFVDESLDITKLSPVQDKLDILFDTDNDAFDAINSVIFKPVPKYIKEPENIVTVMNSPVNLDKIRDKLGTNMLSTLETALQHKLTENDLLTISNPKSIIYYKMGIIGGEIFNNINRTLLSENEEKVFQQDGDTPEMTETDDERTLQELRNIEPKDIYYSFNQVNKIKELARTLSDDVVGLSELKNALAKFNTAVEIESKIDDKDKKEKQTAIKETRDTLNGIKEAIHWLVKPSERQTIGGKTQPVEEKQQDIKTPKPEPVDEEQAAEKEEEEFERERAKNPKQHDTDFLNRHLAALKKHQDIDASVEYGVLKDGGKEYFKFKSGDKKIYLIRDKTYTQDKDSYFTPYEAKADGKLYSMGDKKQLASALIDVDNYLKPASEAVEKPKGKQPETQEQLINRWQKSFINKKLEFKSGTLGDTGRQKWNVLGANLTKPSIQYVIVRNTKDDEADFKKYTLFEVDKSKTTPEEQNQALDDFDDANSAFDALWQRLYPKEKIPVQKSDDKNPKVDELFALLDDYKKMASEKLTDIAVDRIFKTLLEHIWNNKQYLFSFAQKHNIEDRLNTDVSRFYDAKDRVDKVIAIDAFMHLCHQNKGLMTIAFGFIGGDDIISNRVNNILTQLSLDNDNWRMMKQVADSGGILTSADSFTPTFSSGKSKRINLFK